jgi:hypothetical protein
MWRGSPASGQGHTGFYRGETSTLIWIEGGNESDAVRRAFFPRNGPNMGLIGYYGRKACRKTYFFDSIDPYRSVGFGLGCDEQF